MIHNKYICILLSVLSLFCLANKSFAVDVIKLQNQQMSKNKAAHNSEIVRRALEITEDEYGPFELEIINLTMSNQRLHKSAVEGRIFNTVIVLSNKLWDETTLAIKVPARLGLLSYRVLLINKVDQDKFKNIKNLSQLNMFSAGLARGWETTKIFRHHELNVTEIGHFEGIFLMLDKHRFDYIPRGIYEVYDELKPRRAFLENVMVEPTLALNIPTTTYVYVSPTEPRIAKRLNAGLTKMLADGQLKKILYKYYQDDIKKSRLQERTIIKIENPYYDNKENSKLEGILFQL